MIAFRLAYLLYQNKPATEKTSVIVKTLAVVKPKSAYKHLCTAWSRY